MFQAIATVFVAYLPFFEMGIFILACCAVYEFFADRV